MCSLSSELTSRWAAMRVCVQGQGPAPPLAAGRMASGRHVLVLEPTGLCPVPLGVSWCSELALDSVRTGTSSEPTLPRSDVRVEGHGVVVGRPVSAPCLHALVRKGKGDNSLNYVLLRKGFCSQRQAGQTCEFCASRGKTKRVDSLADCIKVFLTPLRVCVQSQLGQGGTSLTFH